MHKCVNDNFSDSMHLNNILMHFQMYHALRLDNVKYLLLLVLRYSVGTMILLRTIGKWFYTVGSWWLGAGGLNTVVIPIRQFGSSHSLWCYSKITFKYRLTKMRTFEYVCFEIASCS